MTDLLGYTTTFTYDPNGNLLTVTDAKQQTTTHTYDPLNRLLTRTDPLTRTASFTYDLVGNLTTATDRKHQTTTVTTDPLNRPTRTEYADGTTRTVSYDAAGNLLTATDTGTGPLTFTYDALNRRTAEQSNSGTVTYAYDPLSRRQALQANGLPPVTYGYDANSRLTGLTQGPQGAALVYDAANRRTTLTLPNGIVLSYSYDAASRLIGQTYTGPSGVLGDLTYSYDATGNRLATGGSFARSGLPTAVPASSYDVANQQLTFGPTAQTFDANGNLLTQTDANGTTTYTCNGRRCIICHIVLPDNSTVIQDFAKCDKLSLPRLLRDELAVLGKITLPNLIELRCSLRRFCLLPHLGCRAVRISRSFPAPSVQGGMRSVWFTRLIKLPSWGLEMVTMSPIWCVNPLPGPSRSSDGAMLVPVKSRTPSGY